MAFFELNIATSGLFASKHGLQVTSNNITNSTTKGYSRQVLNQKASIPLSGIGVGMIGTGVTTTSIDRLRDVGIDNKIWVQSTKLGEANIKVTQHSVIESIFGEPSEVGFTKVFDGLFSSISTLSKDPTSKAAQTALREDAVTFTTYYNTISSALTNAQKDLNSDLKNLVGEINSLATEIQNLNDQIFKAEMNGNNANSFRDERDLCIDRLAEIIDVEAYEEDVQVGDNTVKHFVVKIAGQTLVKHNKVHTLELEVRGEREELINSYAEQFAKSTDKNEKDALIKKLQDLGATVNQNNVISYEANTVLDANGKLTPLVYTKQNVSDVDGLYDVVWSNGATFDMTGYDLSGELKGIIDMRDGAGTGADVEYNGIPYYIERLDQYVRTFAESMNETYSMDQEGSLIIKEVAGVTANVNGQDYPVTLIDKNEDGQITAYYVMDKDGKKVDVTAQMSADQKKSINEGYDLKYKLFAYSDGSSSAIPDKNADLRGGDYSKITAANFSITAEIFDDASTIRTVYDESNASDTTFLNKLMAQKENDNMFKEGDPSDYMVSIFSELGINAQAVKMSQNTRTSVVQNLTNQKLAVSQVDTSEEFSYLIQYQQAYQNAAKLMTTLDEIYDITISKMGNF